MGTRAWFESVLVPELFGCKTFEQANTAYLLAGLGYGWLPESDTPPPIALLCKNSDAGIAAVHRATEHLVQFEHAESSQRVRQWVFEQKIFAHWLNPSPMMVLVVEWRRRSWDRTHPRWVFKVT